VLDPSRIAAQVVSGVGFLGAGTILLRKEIIKGLTTAAAIWVVAAIGLACGAGLLIEAILSTVFTIAVLTLLQPLRNRLRRVPEVQHLRIKVVAEQALLNRIYDICTGAGASMEQVELQTGNGHDKMEIACTTNEANQLAKSLLALKSASGLETLSINLHHPTGEATLFPILTEEEARVQ
jgi:putative Mg2+ transporter-C (MgtC) family protein